MMQPDLKYKGYVGQMTIDPEAGIIHGEVIGLRDVITFQGSTVPEAVQAFRDSVDDYLDFCASLGQPPEKPFSGKFLVRVDPEVHRELAMQAQAKGVSLNSLVGHALLNLARPVRPNEATGTLGGVSIKPGTRYKLLSGAAKAVGQSRASQKAASKAATSDVPAPDEKAPGGEAKAGARPSRSRQPKPVPSK